MYAWNQSEPAHRMATRPDHTSTKMSTRTSTAARLRVRGSRMEDRESSMRVSLRSRAALFHPYFVPRDGHRGKLPRADKSGKDPAGGKARLWCPRGLL